MLVSSLITLLLVSSCAFSYAATPNKSILALWNLNALAECRLGYTALVYDDYGCWCGPGGGYKPEDEIDECCKRHDKCYDYAVDNSICSSVPIEYITDYTWTCQHTSNDKRPEPKCEEGQSKCRQELCWCDKQVVDCWSQYPRPTSRAKCTHRPATLLNNLSDGFVDFFIRLYDSVRNLFKPHFDDTSTS